MIKALKVGDRVRIVGTEYMQPTDAQHARILRGEEVGTIEGLIISRVSVRFGNRSFNVPTGNIERVCIHRTFEEIINELVEKPEIKATFPVLRKYKNGEVDLANHKDDRTITVWPNGDTNFLGLSEITAAQLAAISAACTEIAANYAAEHGKEEQQ